MQTQINLSFSAPCEHSFIAALNAVRASGMTASVNVQAPPDAGKGPLETEWLSISGMQRMRVPSEWQGTREEYASERIKARSNGLADAARNTAELNEDEETEGESYAPSRMFSATDITDEDEDD